MKSRLLMRFVSEQSKIIDANPKTLSSVVFAKNSGSDYELIVTLKLEELVDVGR